VKDWLAFAWVWGAALIYAILPVLVGAYMLFAAIRRGPAALAWVEGGLYVLLLLSLRLPRYVSSAAVMAVPPTLALLQIVVLRRARAGEPGRD
jgi:hypothetical protein